MTNRRTFTDLSPCSDAMWESLRYLSGEMTTVETEAFESRLEHDLAAGESLAQAVLLSEALGQAVAVTSPRPPVATRPMPGRRWYARLTALAGAGLLLAAGWYAGDLARRDVLPVRFPGQDLVAVPAAVSPVDGSVLTVWVALNTDREQAGDEAFAEPVVDTVSETDVPDWMFAALLATRDAEGLLPGMDSLREGPL